MNASCTIDDNTWTTLKSQNTKMPSDEYFQYEMILLNVFIVKFYKINILSIEQ